MLKQLDRPSPSDPRDGFANRVAIVTGSTSGIGLAVARTLAARGATVVLNGFGSSAEIARLRGEIEEETGASTGFHGADISKPAEVADMIASTARTHGSVDILVNNAGVQHVAPIEEFPVEKWDAILAINLSGVFHAIRAAMPAMKQAGWGRIVNIASAHGLVASPYKSAYVAAKHGVVGLTKAAALECAQSGVTVNAVCPGYVWTPLVERQIDEQAKSHGIPREKVLSDVFLQRHPNKRFTTVEELGGLIAFLCSADGATITGAAIPMDGGWTAQ